MLYIEVRKPLKSFELVSYTAMIYFHKKELKKNQNYLLVTLCIVKLAYLGMVSAIYLAPFGGQKKEKNAIISQSQG